MKKRSLSRETFFIMIIGKVDVIRVAALVNVAKVIDKIQSIGVQVRAVECEV